MKYYKTGGYKTDIEEVEVTRVSDKCIWVVDNSTWAKHKGKTDSREYKKTSYRQYHETWKEAHQHLFYKAETKLRNLKNSVDRAEAELIKIGLMSDPNGKS